MQACSVLPQFNVIFVMNMQACEHSLSSGLQFLQYESGQVTQSHVWAKFGPVF